MNNQRKTFHGMFDYVGSATPLDNVHTPLRHASHEELTNSRFKPNVETSVRVANNSGFPVKVLWFQFPPKGSIGLAYSDYLKLTSDKIGSSMLESQTLVVMDNATNG